MDCRVKPGNDGEVVAAADDEWRSSMDFFRFQASPILL
jgi:hypothetical protein